MSLLFAGFIAPYLVAIAAFQFLAVRRTSHWMLPVGMCLLVALSPGLISMQHPVLRFLASLSAATVAIKIIDLWLDIRLRSAPTWQEFLAFLANPFIYVRRCLPREPRPLSRHDLVRFLKESLICFTGIALLVAAFSIDWRDWPFLVEHSTKVVLFMLAIVSGLTALAALWRLTGGTARDYMDRPFAARTPADFWRRYNRNMQQFFWQNVFKTTGGLRAPIRTTFLVFVLSALMHELIFSVAIGRVQGYQMTFFLVQGIAATLTAHVKVKGYAVAPWVVGTFVFNLASSVFFFASIHELFPFYSRGLPMWLSGW